MSAWISTRDELPDEAHTVLIHTDGGEVWVGFLDSRVWRFVSGELADAKVLNWMQFPEPPTEGAR
jgi:hypothetical protein